MCENSNFKNNKNLKKKLIEDISTPSFELDSNALSDEVIDLFFPEHPSDVSIFIRF